MSFRNLSLLLVILTIFVLCLPVLAQTVPVIPLDPPITNNQPPTDSPITRNIQITFHSSAENMLFLIGVPVAFSVKILNSAASQDATVTVSVTSGLGATLFRQNYRDPLMEGETREILITLGKESPLPTGPYRVEVLVKAEKDWGYGVSTFGVWPGPIVTKSDFFGVNFQGPLAVERTMRDFELFRQIGVGWLRLPVQGWIPQGQLIPDSAAGLDVLLRAAQEKKLDILAAFTPQISVDPTINSLQAQKDYNESLLAAAARYGFMVKRWELLTVPGAHSALGLQGIWYGEIKPGRESLARFDKKLQVFYGADDPVSANVDAMLRMELPPKGDGIAVHFNLNSLPEVQKEHTPSELISNSLTKAKQILRRAPPVWVTDFGFHTDLLQNSGQVNTHHAALFARTLLLSRFTNIERLFWRHDPKNPQDLAFTTADGSVQPTYLALRTVLEQIDGLTAVAPVFTSLAGQDNSNIYLLRYDVKKSGKVKKHSKYKLVVWTNRISNRTTLVVRTAASKVIVTDLWGNRQQLQPAGHVVLVQADEFPRFIDVEDDGNAEVNNAGSVAFFTPRTKWLTPGGDNTITFTLSNNQNVFQGNITGNMLFHAWPTGREQEPVEFNLDKYKERTVEFRDLFNDPALFETANNQRLLSEISVEIMQGQLRIGYLTLPVYYSSAGEQPDE